MRKPYLTFALAVVVPAGIAIAAAARTASGAWTALHRASHLRAASMVLAAFEQELGRATDALTRSAEPVADADPSEDAVRRALQGDTVAGIGVRGGEMRLSVVIADSGDLASVRVARGTLVPEAATTVGPATGYAVSMYLNGRRWRATEPPPGPEDLGDVAMRAAADADGGTPFGDGSADPLVLGLGAGSGAPPAVVALVQPIAPPGRAVARPVLLVVGLLLLFAMLAGWIQLAQSGTAPGRPSARSSLVLLSFVPALTVLVFLVHLDRSFRSAAGDEVSRDLARSLAVARIEAMEGSPAGVRALTGFHASRVRAGAVEESTYAGDASALALVAMPPPSFTTSGRVASPEGPAVYVASRLRDGAVLVVSGATPQEETARFRRSLELIGAVLATWLLAAGAGGALWARRRAGRVSSDR